jgi:hypothetical protein
MLDTMANSLTKTRTNVNVSTPFLPGRPPTAGTWLSIFAPESNYWGLLKQPDN